MHVIFLIKSSWSFPSLGLELIEKARYFFKDVNMINRTLHVFWKVILVFQNMIS